MNIYAWKMLRQLSEGNELYYRYKVLQACDNKGGDGKKDLLQVISTVILDARLRFMYHIWCLGLSSIYMVNEYTTKRDCTILRKVCVGKNSHKPP